MSVISVLLLLTLFVGIVGFAWIALAAAGVVTLRRRKKVAHTG